MIRQINSSGEVKFTGKNFEQVVKIIPETSGTLIARGNKENQLSVQVVKFRVKSTLAKPDNLRKHFLNPGGENKIDRKSQFENLIKDKTYDYILITWGDY